MEIITKRFLLREFIEEDEPAFIAYHADPQYAEFCAPEEVTPEYARSLLGLFGQWAVEQPRSNYQFAIRLWRLPFGQSLTSTTPRRYLAAAVCVVKAMVLTKRN